MYILPLPGFYRQIAGFYLEFIMTCVCTCMRMCVCVAECVYVSGGGMHKLACIVHLQAQMSCMYSR